MNAQTQANPQGEQYIKILADGTRVPAADPRTDHPIVLDTTRNIEIYVNSVGRARGYDLKAAVEQLDVFGGGWRMADDEEACSIIRRDSFNPAFDANLFPGLKAERHFTSKPAAWAPARAAWCVNFYFGYVFLDDLDDDGWALAVRPAGQ